MLNLVPNKANKLEITPPKVKLGTVGNTLNIEFEHNYELAPHVSEKFGHEYQNWGLWDYDVFEVFLTRSESSKLPYLEIQVSPLNQKFALLINKPRENTEYPKSCPFQAKNEFSGDLWKSSISIDIQDIPGESETINGNIHAILGTPRNYFSMNVNPEEAPDFHRPEYFTDILKARP